MLRIKPRIKKESFFLFQRLLLILKLILKQQYNVHKI